ncbi:hypothetical protein ACO03V_05385 [Microbacterium sp. HMH0099]|uniref:hypothetical protein n=1 Tax=Microbacterium sp. HMH0099 TaxID=3414026 RepID=UPI003BF744D0
MSAPAARSFWRRVIAWVDLRFRSAAAIYGLIVFTAFVVIAEDHAEDVWDVLLTALGTLVVFYIAHVFAQALTSLGDHGFRASALSALQHGSAMLFASVPSTLVLVVGGVTGMPVTEATSWCTLATFLVLAILGFHAYHRRGADLPKRFVAAAATATLGLLIVALEAVFH